MKKILLTAFICSSVFTVSFAQYPLVSIYDLQYVDPQTLANGKDTSLYLGDTVQVEGIVSFDPCDYGLSTTGSRNGTFLQTSGGGAWNGVHVLIDPGALGYSGTLNDLNNAVQYIDNFQVGNKVKCTGIVTSFGLLNAPIPGNTQILLLPQTSTLTGIGQPVPVAEVLTVDQFMKSDGGGAQLIQRETGEQWEGVYVQLDNVQVVDVSYGSGSSAGRIFWSVQDAAGNKMKTRDFSGWVRNDTSDNFCTSMGSNTPDAWDIAPLTNATISFIKGIIFETCSSSTGTCEYYIGPLDLSDIGESTAAPPIVSNVQLSNTVPTTSQTQLVSATITDADGTIVSASLYYSIGLGNTTFTSLAMSQSGSTWSGTIPATATDSSYVNYWIKAIDNEGNFTNYPDSLATNSFYWVINSGINSIKDIQFNPTGNAVPFLAGKWITSNMNVEGTVMSTIGFFDLGLTTIQDGDGAWHGIFLRGQNLSSLQRGDKIKITSGKVFENFNVTFLDSTTYLVLSNNNALYAPHFGLSEDSIDDAKFNSTEPFEGVLIGFNNMFAVNQNPDDPGTFGEWAIDDNSSDNIGMRCDDYSNDIGFDFGLDSLSLNQQLDYIYGVLYYSFGNWKMLPRNKNDIAGYKTITGIENDPMNQLEATVYPNPASDVLNISLSLRQQVELNIQLVNATGQVIYSADLSFSIGENAYSISLKDFSSGIYLVRIQGDNFSYLKKVVFLK